MIGVIASVLIALKIAGLGTIATSEIVIWVLIALLVNIIVDLLKRK